MLTFKSCTCCCIIISITFFCMAVGTFNYRRFSFFKHGHHVFVSFAVNSSLHQVREGHKKDIFAGLLGTTRKKRRHGDKKGSASSVSEEDFVASKFGYNTNSSKTRSKGLSGNRSAENILQLEEETAVALEDDAASETVEVSFEVRKKYDMKEMNYFCIENEKRSIRRAKSNDSLLMQHRIVVRQPNRIPAQTQEKSQTLPSDRSTSQETLDDYASSGDTTTSDDGRNESRGSSILESELWRASKAVWCIRWQIRHQRFSSILYFFTNVKWYSTTVIWNPCARQQFLWSYVNSLLRCRLIVKQTWLLSQR